MLKRTRSLVMVEAVNKSQPLVKKLLRLRILRGDRVMQVAEAGYEGDGVSLSMRLMILRGGASANQNSAQKVSQKLHLVLLKLEFSA
jgi:hypothetical protein